MLKQHSTRFSIIAFVFFASLGFAQKEEWSAQSERFSSPAGAFAALLLSQAPAAAFTALRTAPRLAGGNPPSIGARHRQCCSTQMTGIDASQQAFIFEYLVCCKGTWGEFRRMDAFARASRAALSKGGTIHFLHDDGALLTLQPDFMGQGKPWGSPSHETSEKQLIAFLHETKDGKTVPGIALRHLGQPDPPQLHAVMETALDGCDEAWVLSEDGEQLLSTSASPPHEARLTRVLVALGGVRDMRREEVYALEDVCRSRGVKFYFKSLGLVSELSSKCIKFLEVAKEGWLKSSHSRVAQIQSVQKTKRCPLHVVVYLSSEIRDFMQLPIAATLVIDAFKASFYEYDTSTVTLVSKEQEVLTIRSSKILRQLSVTEESEILHCIQRRLDEESKNNGGQTREYLGLQQLLMKEHGSLDNLHLLHADESAPLLAQRVGTIPRNGTNGPVAVIFGPSKLKLELEIVKGKVAAYACASLGHWSLALSFVRMMHNQNLMATAIHLVSQGNATHAPDVQEIPPDSNASHLQYRKTQRVWGPVPTPWGAAKTVQSLVQHVGSHVLLIVSQGLEDVAVHRIVESCGISREAIHVLPTPSFPRAGESPKMGQAAVGKIVVTLHGKEEDHALQLEQLYQSGISTAILGLVAAAEGMSMSGGFVRPADAKSSTRVLPKTPTGVLAEVSDLVYSSPHWASALSLLAAAGPPHVHSFRASAVSSGANLVGIDGDDVFYSMGYGAVQTIRDGVHGNAEWSVSLHSFDVELFGLLCDGHFAAGFVLDPKWRRNITYFNKKYEVVPFCDHIGRPYWDGPSTPFFMKRLRPSTAMSLLLLAGVQHGDTVLDPFGGIGTIAIEAATHYENVTSITSDAHSATALAAEKNVMLARPHVAGGSSLSSHCWDARELSSIADGSVDRYVAELSFGDSFRRDVARDLPRRFRKVISSDLVDVLSEVRRVLRPKTGRCVLLASGLASFERVLSTLNASQSAVAHTSEMSAGTGIEEITSDRVIDSTAGDAGEQLPLVGKEGSDSQQQTMVGVLVFQEKRQVVILGEMMYAMTLRVE